MFIAKNMLNTHRNERKSRKRALDSTCFHSTIVFQFRWKHERFCEVVERKIDFETEYAEYELSKESVRAEKRQKQKQKIKAGCKILCVIFFILMLLGEFYFFAIKLKIVVWFFRIIN